MSCYEWERGTIKLPSNQTATVKAAVRQAVLQHREKVHQVCRAWWAEHKTTSQARYLERLGEFWDWAQKKRIDDSTASSAQSVLRHIVKPWTGDPRKPRQVQQKDLDAVLGEKPTNRTSTYRIDHGEALISFDGNVATWEVYENNHACETARANLIAVAFFNALDKVKWTRGSGGEIIGNNEYNREADYEGGGGNYVTDRYGPKFPRQTTRRYW